jgi:hypothetical protein
MAVHGVQIEVRMITVFAHDYIVSSCSARTCVEERGERHTRHLT